MFFSMIISLLLTIPTYLVCHMFIFLPVTEVIVKQSRTFFASFMCNAVIYLFVIVIFTVLFVYFRSLRDPYWDKKILKDHEGKKYSFGRDLLIILCREKWVLVLFAILSFLSQAVCRFGRLYLMDIGSPIVAIVFTGFLPFSYPSSIRLYGYTLDKAFLIESLVVYAVSLLLLCAIYVLVYGIFRWRSYRENA